MLLVGVAVGLGAFTIGRRTIATMGEGLTEMPLLAALVVAIVSSTLVTILSWFDIPVSVVIIATMSIVGLGWGRATRTVDERTDPLATGGTSVGEAVVADEDLRDPGATDEAAELFEPATTAKVIALQNLVPAISTIAAYLVFRFLTVF